MAHAGERLELERAFSGATVHDMFNMFLRSTVRDLSWHHLGLKIGLPFWFAVRFLLEPVALSHYLLPSRG